MPNIFFKNKELGITPTPPIDLTSETTHVGGSFDHIGNKKIQICYSVFPEFSGGISVKKSSWKCKTSQNQMHTIAK